MSMRGACMLLIAAAFLPSCSTSEEMAGAVPARTAVLSIEDLVETILGRQTAHDVVENLPKQEGGALASSLRRSLADVLKNAPRLHVRAQRRSVKEEEGMRLEVEETGHAVTVSRAHLHRARLRRPESVSAASTSQKFHVNAIDQRLYTISPETVASAVHRYLNATPQFLLSNNCSAQAQSKTPSNWDRKGYNQISHAVAGTSEIIAVVAVDPRTFKLEQWVNDQDQRNTQGIVIDSKKVGWSIVRYNYNTGKQKWVSGTGAIGLTDGVSVDAAFSASITSLAWHPTCSSTDWGNEKCPPFLAGPARPYFFQPVQWIYVADSGNCRVRLVDYDTGEVRSRWGRNCLPEGSKEKDELWRYQDSEISSRNVLGGYLALAWVQWKFLLVVDRDAHRIRKFVTSQHQGLSALAGAFNTSACSNWPHTDGDGLSATFCRPQSVVASADGSRAVVSEQLSQYGVGDAYIRLRVMDFQYTYLEGGDVGNVTCRVRTLRRMTMTYPGNALLWSNLGGIVMTPDGSAIIAGSADPGMLDFRWSQGVYDTGGYSFVVALDVETGALKLLLDDAGVPLHDATPVAAVGGVDAGAAGDAAGPWYRPAASSVDVVLAQHSPDAQSTFADDVPDITWTNPLTSIQTLRFSVAALKPSCVIAPPPLNTTSAEGMAAIAAKTTTNSAEGIAGIPAKTTTAHENLARSCDVSRTESCTTEQSSLLQVHTEQGSTDLIAGYANDGNASSCSSTADVLQPGSGSDFPWWKLDFGRMVNVTDVWLYGPKRLEGVSVYVGNNATRPSPGKGIVGNFLCAANQVVPAESPDTRVTCSTPLVGQYLYIQIPAVNSTLTLCEVKVNGSYCGTNAWTDHCTLPAWNPRGLVTCPEDCVGLRSKVDEENAGLHKQGGASGAGTLLAAAHGGGGGGGGAGASEAPEANLRGSNKGTHSSGARGLSKDQPDRDSIVVYDGGGSLRLVTWKLINHLVEDARKRSTNPAFV